MIVGNKIEACKDERVIEAVYRTKMSITPFYFDKVSDTVVEPELIATEYILQTFFGNDIEIRVGRDGVISDFYLCNIGSVDWEDDEKELYDAYDKVNRDIARLYAEKVKVVVVTDKNWRRGNG